MSPHPAQGYLGLTTSGVTWRPDATRRLRAILPDGTSAAIWRAAGGLAWQAGAAAGHSPDPSVLRLARRLSEAARARRQAAGARA